MTNIKTGGQSRDEAAAGRIRIVVADSYPIFRRGLADAIASEPDMELCASVDDTRDALRLVTELKPDVMLFDICLSGGSALGFIEQASVSCRIVALSIYEETLYADRVLRAGARAYLTRQRQTDEFLSAIRSVYGGGTEICEHSKSCAKCGARQENTSPLVLLSNRELEVFRLIGRGLPSRIVADRLHLSPKTVESHRDNIKKKLGVKTSSELLMCAMLWTMPKGFHEANGDGESSRVMHPTQLQGGVTASGSEQAAG